MHRAHGDIHVIGLQDDCEACEAHAAKPWSSLDEDMLYKLIRRNYDFRFNITVDSVERMRYQPRSDTEAIAMANITNVMEQMGALFSADKDHVLPTYLERQWKVYLV